MENNFSNTDEAITQPTNQDNDHEMNSNDITENSNYTNQ